MVVFITIDKETKQAAKWCTCGFEDKLYFDFMQYLLDGCTGLEDFYICEIDDQETITKMYHFMDIVEYYGMRKRSFMEKLENVKTGNYELREAVA